MQTLGIGARLTASCVFVISELKVEIKLLSLVCTRTSCWCDKCTHKLFVFQMYRCVYTPLDKIV